MLTKIALVVVVATLMTGCDTPPRQTTFVAPSGQILDANGNPLYPPLEYEREPDLE